MKTIDWTLWQHLLGTMSDAELAKKIGCIGYTVYKKRKTLGILAFEKHVDLVHVDWDSWQHLLGTMSDVELAKKIGCSHVAVGDKRKKLGIPVFVNPEIGCEDRVCPICKGTFRVFKSSPNITCSPRCRRLYLKKINTGKSRKWESEKAKATIARKKAEGVPRETILAGIEAIKSNPRFGAFETNLRAYYWVLEDPDGKVHEFRNLNFWSKKNVQLFGFPPEQWKRIRGGINQLKRSIEGKTPRPVDSYKGWTLLSWKSVEEEVYTPIEVTQMLGIKAPALSARKNFENNPLRKAIIVRDGKTLYAKSVVDAIKKERDNTDLTVTYSRKETADILEISMGFLSYLTKTNSVIREARIYVANVLVQRNPRYKKNVIDRIKAEYDSIINATYSIDEISKKFHILKEKIRQEIATGYLRKAKVNLPWSNDVRISKEIANRILPNMNQSQCATFNATKASAPLGWMTIEETMQIAKVGASTIRKMIITKPEIFKKEKRIRFILSEYVTNYVTKTKEILGITYSQKEAAQILGYTVAYISMLTKTSRLKNAVVLLPSFDGGKFRYRLRKDSIDAMKDMSSPEETASS
jgi:hypothetical protein